ncbi:MAG: O-antigen polymerase [Vicinamibacterales bacterium]
MILFGLVLIAIALVAVPVSRAWTGDYLPPATIFTAAWSLSLGLYFLRLLPYPPLTATTATLIAAASALFLGGVALGQWLLRHPAAPGTAPPGVMGANAWVLSYSAIGLAGVAWYAWLVVVILGRAALSDPYTVRRALGTYEIPSSFLFLQFFCLASPLLAGAFWLSGRRLSRLAIAGAVLCSLATWLTTDRTQFFTLVLGLFFMFVFSRARRLSWTGLVATVIVAGLLLAANFLIIGALMGKTPANLGVGLQLPATATGGPSASPLARFMSRGSTLYLYATASYGALNTLVADPGPRRGGVYTVYPIARLLERVGLIHGPVPPYIPGNSWLHLQGTRDIEFNGYTFLVYALYDFGIAGAIAYAGIIGILSGAAFAWARARRESPFGLLIVAHLSIALTLSMFVNKFNNTASWYIAVASMLPLLLGAWFPATTRVRTD